MKANSAYLDKSTQFWGYVRIISEKVGYSERGASRVKNVTKQEAQIKLNSLNISIEEELLDEVVAYINYRADLLNNEVRNNLMNVEQAKEEYLRLEKQHIDEGYSCSLPYNKQKKEKKDRAFFTGIINILTEEHLRKYAEEKGLKYNEDISFDYDPRALTYLANSENEVLGAFSRRFDGAFPSTINPIAIWEIKEYYYTTTFGSRVADGVYETQLDGYEINELSRTIGNDIKHIYFIDAFKTWWVDGKPYLCRIIDMLHMGLVDEVICGKEVLTRWSDVLGEILDDWEPTRENIEVKPVEPVEQI